MELRIVINDKYTMIHKYTYIFLGLKLSINIAKMYFGDSHPIDVVNNIFSFACNWHFQQWINLPNLLLVSLNIADFQLKFKHVQTWFGRCKTVLTFKLKTTIDLVFAQHSSNYTNWVIKVVSNVIMICRWNSHESKSHSCFNMIGLLYAIKCKPNEFNTARICVWYLLIDSSPANRSRSWEIDYPSDSLCAYAVSGTSTGASVNAIKLRLGRHQKSVFYLLCSRISSLLRMNKKKSASNKKAT